MEFIQSWGADCERSENPMRCQEGDCCQPCCPPVECYGSPADKTRIFFVSGQSVHIPVDNNKEFVCLRSFS